MTYIIRTPHGAFCAVCQSPLSLEEDDFDTCDTCGGLGLGDADDEQTQNFVEECDAFERAELECRAALADPAGEPGGGA